MKVNKTKFLEFLFEKFTYTPIMDMGGGKDKWRFTFNEDQDLVTFMHEILQELKLEEKNGRTITRGQKLDK